MKRLAAASGLFLFFCIVTAAYGTVIGDFEGGFDNWVAGAQGSPTLSISTNGVTSGSHSLAVKLGNSSGYWCLQWAPPSVPALPPGTRLMFDVTMIQSEWGGSIWTKVADKVAINTDNATGWKEFYPPQFFDTITGAALADVDWGGWSPTITKTYSLDISDYDLTGATWFQLNISVQQNSAAGAGSFYFDNIRLGLPGPEYGASDPQPPDGTTDVRRDVVLTWSPDESAATHDVYFGSNYDDVSNATEANPLGVLVSQGQDANSFDPPGLLTLGQTYYWRIDEVNGPPDLTVHRGAIWSFTAEPLTYVLGGSPGGGTITATASSTAANSSAQNTVNGQGLTGDLHSEIGSTMWLSAAAGPQPSWIQYAFDRLYRLDSMWVWNYNAQFEDVLGLGIKDALVEYSADGLTWTTLGTFTFPWAPGAPGHAHDAEVSFGGVGAKFVKITAVSNWGGGARSGLSEVRFFHVIDYAREPKPATGAADVAPDTTLTWRAGREAASHQVYLSSERNAVVDGSALIDTVSENSYTPAPLDLGTTYYWKINEVNEAVSPAVWEGDIWNFSTEDYILVDGMETYTDEDGNRIYQTWADGYGTTTNGSQAGYTESPFAEGTTVHSGSQSMPLSYDNTGGITSSEVTRTFTEPMDWTMAGIKTLVLYFYGDPNNAPAQMYVKINNTKVPYAGDPDSIMRSRWNQWSVDLSAVPASTLKGVTTLTIGIGIGGASGSGRLFIDDIRLYKSAPPVSVAVNPGTTGLVAYYAMSNNVQDSSGNGNNGTLAGAPTYVGGLAAYGTALKLNGTADCVDLGSKAVWNPAGSFSVSLWAKIGAWATDWDDVMVANRGEDNVGWQIRRPNNNSLCFTTRGVGNDDMTSLALPPLNEWIHIGCVYDDAGNTKTIYLNGVEDSAVTTTAGAHVTATTHKTYIGARANSGNTGPEAYFTGQLDEVRVFSRALSAGEMDYLSDPTP
jgi:hypothetical protein